VFWRTDQRLEDGKPRLVRVIYYRGEVAIKNDFMSDGNTFVFCFDTVREMFEAFRDDACIRVDADILTGWNIFGFDIPFMIEEYQNQFKSLDSRLTMRDARRAAREFALWKKEAFLGGADLHFPQNFAFGYWNRVKDTLGSIWHDGKRVRDIVWDTWKKVLKERFLFATSKGADTTPAMARSAARSAHRVLTEILVKLRVEYQALKKKEKFKTPPKVTKGGWSGLILKTAPHYITLAKTIASLEDVVSQTEQALTGSLTGFDGI